ncbi:MAG: 23S rRNA (adenine(2503)-C(2))-methyltransferase RlmN [Clostridiales bacterium]|nr:23S rRNA (adenine(2503)-C(2))-methyltransferase RlmN [Clostridiales bacterium]
MTGLTSKNIAELQQLMAELGEPKFRAKQVFSWISRGARPEEMTNLSKVLREKLATLHFGGARIYDKRISTKDGTIKYLFELEDGNLVEGVLMRYKYGNTLCVSTQVGCRMGCAFCASTLNGCVRDLEAGEILSFVACAEKDVPCEEGRKRSVTNIVLMGSGEPLDNYENVVRFLQLVSAPEGMNISPRNISLSTCGLVPQLRRFMKEAPRVTLSVSLHAPNDTIRNTIMPVNAAYPMAELLGAAREYAEETGRRVIFEYALIKNKNSEKKHAEELASRLRRMNCHVNLIPLNHVEERNLMGVTRKDAEQFMGWLTDLGISATIRREMGSDIEGACGQLRRRVLEQQEGNA